MDKIYDVIQVGYGPVSQALALMLGRQGRSVAVCERWTKRYHLPRAVALDHEIYRILSANGMGQVLPSVSHPGMLYQWFNADWKKLLEINWTDDSISGGPGNYFVHQPTLEEVLDASVNRLPNVELYLGWDAVQVEQSDDLAFVTMRNTETGETRRLSARYVVGCDGANSLVRKTIGGKQEDRGFEANWLVVDVLLKEGRTIESLGIPGAAQYCHPDYPTTIVPAGIRGGRTFRRWEFMQLPGEDVQDMEREDKVWKRLKPWVGPDDVELVRHRVYNFRSLLADKWCDGRLIIAGDAAHVMPPFLGQGMCSGFRDAWNLAWKLDLILSGHADGRLLDTYQPERMPHVSQIIDMSIFLGKIICMPDANEAAGRDAMFLSGNAPPMPSFPSLMNGLLHRDAGGQLAKGAGLLAPHADFLTGDGRGRQDDLFGPGFLVIALGGPEKLLDTPTREALAVLGANLISLDDRNSANFAEDITGRYSQYFAKQGWTAMIVRPDYYVYGGVGADAELQSLTSDMLANLVCTGVDRVT